MSEKSYSQFDDEITIANLFPDLTPEQQAEAEYRMLRYLSVIKEIFEQLCEEKPELLTKLERQFMLMEEINHIRKL